MDCGGVTLSRGKGLAKIGKKLPTCPICENKYTRKRVGQKVCETPKCAMEWVKRKQVAARVAPYVTKPSRNMKARREANENDKKHVSKQAKAALHKWIVAVRDADKPCVSSGRTESRQWQAGHFRPATQSMTRYDESNIHKQSVDDNYWRSGNVGEYRIELLKRIGADEVDRIESSAQIKRWTIEELREIRDEYRKRLRDNGIPIPTTY